MLFIAYSTYLYFEKFVFQICCKGQTTLSKSLKDKQTIWLTTYNILSVVFISLIINLHILCSFNYSTVKTTSVMYICLMVWPDFFKNRIAMWRATYSVHVAIRTHSILMYTLIDAVFWFFLHSCYNKYKEVTRNGFQKSNYYV